MRRKKGRKNLLIPLPRMKKERRKRNTR